MTFCCLLMLAGCVLISYIIFKERKTSLFSNKIFLSSEKSTVDSGGNSIITTNKKNKEVINALRVLSLVVYNNDDLKRNAFFLATLSTALTFYGSGKIKIFPPLVNYLFFFAVSFTFLFLIVAVIFYMKKSARFSSDFIAFIDLFSSHCSSGKSIPNSLVQSINSLRHNILRIDLEKIYFLLSNGVPIQQCVSITETTKRFPYLYYNLFFTMLAVSIDKGGELDKNIAWLRDQMVKKKKIEDKINTLTAEAKMSRNILVALPMAFMAITYFFNKPNFLWLINTHAGNMVLIISWGLIGFGILICSLIVSNATKA